jgi:chemotaxis regulatin CheY-phosphate phosphatase CheZ
MSVREHVAQESLKISQKIYDDSVAQHGEVAKDDFAGATDKGTAHKLKIEKAWGVELLAEFKELLDTNKQHVKDIEDSVKRMKVAVVTQNSNLEYVELHIMAAQAYLDCAGEIEEKLEVLLQEVSGQGSGKVYLIGLQRMNSRRSW